MKWCRLAASYVLEVCHSPIRAHINIVTDLSSPIDIVYQDDELVVVNKPSGLLSVPGRGEDKQDCVVKRVQRIAPTARIVHRLDCATSGLMVLGLSADSHRELSRQFHDREVSKRYVASVFGKLKESSGEVDLPLMTDWPNRPRQMVSEEGKKALTRYKLIANQLLEHQGNAYECSRVELEPVTGRSHQLRVHMMSLGHPILGDRLYADGEALALAPRLLLHASKLTITNPMTGERLEFDNAPPF